MDSGGLPPFKKHQKLWGHVLWVCPARPDSVALTAQWRRRAVAWSNDLTEDIREYCFPILQER